MDELNQRISKLEQAFNSFVTNTQLSDIQYRKTVQDQLDTLRAQLQKLTVSPKNTSICEDLQKKVEDHEVWLNLVDKAIKTLREENKKV